MWVNKAAGHGSYAPKIKSVRKKEKKKESFLLLPTYFGVSL